MLTAEILLEHRKGGCTGAWRLESRAEGYHWRCPSCMRLYPASVQTSCQVAWERRVTELMDSLALGGGLVRDPGAQ